MPDLFGIDCHAHVFAAGVPLAAGSRYAPIGEATLADYLAMLAANGMSHGVLVQPSFLGTDNSYLVKALRASQKLLRGIAVVDPGASDHTLQELRAAGCVGVRLNLIGQPDPGFQRTGMGAALATPGRSSLADRSACRGRTPASNLAAFAGARARRSSSTISAALTRPRAPTIPAFASCWPKARRNASGSSSPPPIVSGVAERENAGRG